MSLTYGPSQLSRAVRAPSTAPEEKGLYLEQVAEVEEHVCRRGQGALHPQARKSKLGAIMMGERERCPQGRRAFQRLL